MKKYHYLFIWAFISSLSLGGVQTLEELQKSFLDPSLPQEVSIRAFHELTQKTYPEKFKDFKKALTLYHQTLIGEYLKNYILAGIKNPDIQRLSQGEASKLFEYAYHLYYFRDVDPFYLKELIFDQLQNTSLSLSIQQTFLRLLGYMSTDFEFLDYRDAIDVLEERAVQSKNFMERSISIEALGRVMGRFKDYSAWVKTTNRWLRESYKFEEHFLVKSKIITVLSQIQNEENKTFFEEVLQNEKNSLILEEAEKALKRFD
ncbi:MAG: HEAT repeat domain-containing protein [Deltaproteobacteria bacterium]|nr:HEAT repeat domain-containing protein [Deltaproteobacteria bacterium]